MFINITPAMYICLQSARISLCLSLGTISSGPVTVRIFCNFSW